MLKKLLNRSSGKTWTTREEEATQAKDLMHASPITLPPDHSIGQAAKLILEHQFNAIPIEKNGVLIGLLSVADLIRYAFATSIVHKKVA